MSRKSLILLEGSSEVGKGPFDKASRLCSFFLHLSQVHPAGPRCDPPERHPPPLAPGLLPASSSRPQRRQRRKDPDHIHAPHSTRTLIGCRRAGPTSALKAGLSANQSQVTPVHGPRVPANPKGEREKGVPNESYTEGRGHLSIKKAVLCHLDNLTVVGRVSAAL